MAERQNPASRIATPGKQSKYHEPWIHADAATSNGVKIIAVRRGRSFSGRDHRNKIVMTTASVSRYGRPRAKRVVHAGTKTEAMNKAASHASGRRNHGNAHNVTSS